MTRVTLRDVAAPDQEDLPQHAAGIAALQCDDRPGAGENLADLVAAMLPQLPLHRPFMPLSAARHERVLLVAGRAAGRLSVAIITLNEEASLPRTLDSVAWCDDVVVVDSGSRDRTVEIASARPNCRVIRQDFLGYGRQKRVAVEAAANDWVLSIDADEVLDARLQATLQEWSRQPPGSRYQTY